MRSGTGKAIARLCLGFALLLLVAAAAGYVGYQIGGRVGFVSGYSAASVSADTTNAAFATFALRALRGGDVSRGISILEQSVDGGILSYWTYLKTCGSEFDRSGVVAQSYKVMRVIADYRKLHPPVSKDERVLKMISEALASVHEHRSAAAQPSAAAAGR